MGFLCMCLRCLLQRCHGFPVACVELLQKTRLFSNLCSLVCSQCATSTETSKTWSCFTASGKTTAPSRWTARPKSSWGDRGSMRSTNTQTHHAEHDNQSDEFVRDELRDRAANSWVLKLRQLFSKPVMFGHLKVGASFILSGNLHWCRRDLLSWKETLEITSSTKSFIPSAKNWGVKRLDSK